AERNARTEEGNRADDGRPDGRRGRRRRPPAGHRLAGTAAPGLQPQLGRSGRRSDPVRLHGRRGPYERRQLMDLAAFCHYWGMTPDEAAGLDGPTYRAFVEYANRDIRTQNRAARKAGRSG